MNVSTVFKKTALFLLVIFFLAALLAGSAVAMLFYWASRDLPDLNRIAEYKQPQAAIFLARDGSLLGTLYHEKRFQITLKEMSRHVPLAFLAAEDDAFYHHMGVDPVAIVRAAINNFRKGAKKEGASTITQQLIKQLLLTSERSYTRKMKEAILAWQLEKTFTKDQILTIYLNQIYLGEHSYGVEAAARTYFGKHASDITLAESAVLAGLPKAPSTYNPFRRPLEAKNRQMYVLGRMRDLKWISIEEYERAAAEPLVYWSMPENTAGPAQWYLEEARRLLIEFFTESNLKALGVSTHKYGEDFVYEAGLVVRTAMDPVHQTAAGAALRKGLEDVDKRQGWRGPLAKLDAERQKKFSTSGGFSPYDLGGGNWVKAMISGSDAKGIRVQLGSGYTGFIPASSMAWARKISPKAPPSVKAARQFVPGDVIWVTAAHASQPAAEDKKRSKGDAAQPKSAAFDPAMAKPGTPIPLRLQQEPLVQGAIASVEPQTGDVVALIGGYQFGESHFNRATQARRQPGSSFKPVVYSTAMDFGFTPSSTVLDAPFVYVNPYTNEVWRPSNFEHNYKGAMPLHTALALSRNTCTVRVAQQVGIANVVDRAKALGLEPHFPRELSISLGAVAVSPLNLTQAYAAFANQGLGVRPRIITSITDAQGRTLYKQDVEHWQAISPQNAYIMATLLKEVVNAGTGGRARIEGRVIAGKTGTTNDTHDVWFIGFSPYLVTGVYVGYDQVDSLGRQEQGGRTAAPIFRQYRLQVENRYPADDFAMPEGIVMSGGLAYRSDMPLRGDSAMEGASADAATVDTADEGENLMRQF
ncbi:MAG: PBP1A family penicillin-binding protein [Desulfovibrio sp.]|nr:PBP1A family penicillin-binding protein [Desulfovibrio sp.]